MKNFLFLAALVASFAFQVAAQTPTTSHNYEFANGNWFDGQKFVQRTFYSVAGALTTKRPKRIDRVFDFSNKFIVPPFGEAHNHNLDWSSDQQFARINKLYVDAGIFYVKNPNSLLRSKQPTDARINLPTSVDGVRANGGLTGPGGHPIEIVTAQRGFQPDDGEGNFYYVIDTAADVDHKWPAILAGKPDFIKTYLLYSEEFAKRKEDTAYNGWKGLDPAVLKDIVRRAHAAGLRVSTHVETATDFHNAVVAGVDEINHLPGFRPDRNDFSNYKDPAKRYGISDDDAKLAAQKHIVVVTTIGEAVEATFNEKYDEKDRVAVREMLIGNLNVLRKHHVSIAIGSDSFRHTAQAEALSLTKLKSLDNLTLLKMWCEDTAATIFPKRKIGYLKDGYEANFLVLTGNPLTDFANVKAIEVRFKHGEPL